MNTQVAAVELARLSRRMPKDARSDARRPRTRLDVYIQYAAPRSNVPHARSLKDWAEAAYAAAIDLSSSLQPPASSLTVRIVGAREGRRLNRTWRGKDKPTNVLSFAGVAMPVSPEATGYRLQATARGERAQTLAPPASSPQLPAHLLGDLVICAPVVTREAREQSKQLRAHWAHMVVHGVLHLLGYDHENERDAEVMEAREAAILKRFGYANPYV